MPVHPQDEWVGDETAELSDLAGRAGYQLNLQAMRKIVLYRYASLV
jgi:hypothetical protein